MLARVFILPFENYFVAYFNNEKALSKLNCLWHCYWAIVVARSFHFTITALIVDRGSSSRAEIWRTDLLERWHRMMVPRWKSLSSSVRPFYCQCLSMEIVWLCAWFYTPVSNGCGWNSRSSATPVADSCIKSNTKPCNLHRQTLAVEWHIPRSSVTFNVIPS